MVVVGSEVPGALKSDPTKSIDDRVIGLAWQLVADLDDVDEMRRKIRLRLGVPFGPSSGNSGRHPSTSFASAHEDAHDHANKRDEGNYVLPRQFRRPSP